VLINRLVGDGRSDDNAVDVDAEMRGGRALIDVYDLAGERVAGGNFICVILRAFEGNARSQLLSLAGPGDNEGWQV
jgi:hypothetical protein